MAKKREVKDIVIDIDHAVFYIAPAPTINQHRNLNGGTKLNEEESDKKLLKRLKKAFKKRVQSYVDIAEVESIANDYKIGKTIIIASDPSNFRYDIFPDYKKGRKGRVQTRGFDLLRAWVQKKYAPKQNVEADDVVAWHVRNGALGFSTDKDLLEGVDGIWFNVHHDHMDWVYTSKRSAKRFNLIQCVMGDSTDGIKGIVGVGKVKAIDLLDTYGWSYSGVLKAYHHHSLSIKEALLTHRLVSMRQWSPKGGLQMHTQLKEN